MTSSPGIARLEDGPTLIGPLAALGYDYAGDKVVPGHHIFGKGEERTHLLHIVEYGSPIWTRGVCNSEMPCGPTPSWRGSMRR